MITKKDWDNIPLSAKREILAIIFGEDFERFSQSKALLYAYHHNFNHDETGERLKKVLQQLYRSSDNTINVRVNVTYSTTNNEKFLKSPEPVKHSVANNVLPVQRKRWQCDYTDKSGDLSHAWCFANNKEEARSRFLSEYWDMDSIIQIYEIK